jgi:hypothetical protein
MASTVIANTLFVCNDDPDPKDNKAELRAFELSTGTAKGSYPFDGGGLCNDIAVARDGTIFVTDTRGGRILTLKPVATALGVLPPDGRRDPRAVAAISATIRAQAVEKLKALFPFGSNAGQPVWEPPACTVRGRGRHDPLNQLYP